jgi:hypothetical protein
MFNNVCFFTMISNVCVAVAVAVAVAVDVAVAVAVALLQVRSRGVLGGLAGRRCRAPGGQLGNVPRTGTDFDFIYNIYTTGHCDFISICKITIFLFLKC